MNRKLMRTAIVLITLLVTLIITAIPVYAGTQPIIEDGGFEKNTANWNTYTWYDATSVLEIVDDVARTGSHSFMISSPKENDARIYQEIIVEPNSYYTVTAYIRTQDVPESTDSQYHVGATISVMNTTFISESVEGTTGWTPVEFSFLTSEKTDTVELCFTLGGYGSLNSGIAWFDDIEVVKVSERPDHCYALSSLDKDDEEKTKVKEKNWAGYELNDNPYRVKWMAIYAVYFFLLSLVVIGYAKSGALKTSGKKTVVILIAMLTASAIFRALVAIFGPSYTYDTGLFKYWSWAAAKDLFNIYNANLSYLDYPPLYLIMLAPVGLYANAASISTVADGGLSLFFLRLPAMTCDLISAIVIFRFVKKYADEKWALVLSVFYVLNPMVWVNSASWGQVDSIFALIIMAMLICMFEKKWIGTGFFFALSVLLKPHGIIFTPAVGMATLVELIRNKRIKPLIATVVSGIATFVIVLLPFYIRMGFENPLWIVDLYKGTVGNYNYVTFNGFNFWAMLGKNLTSANNLFLGASYSFWGTLAIAVSCMLAIIFTLAGTRENVKAKNAVPTIVSMVVLVTVFTFAHKMHERYMFAAVIIAILAFIQTRDKGFLHVAILFSLVVFINTWYVYDIHVMWTYPHPDMKDKWVMVFGGIEFFSFIWMMAVTIRVLCFNKILKPKSMRELPDIVIEEKIREPKPNKKDKSKKHPEGEKTASGITEDKESISCEDQTEA